MYPCTGNLLLWQGRYWRWVLKPYLDLGANPQDGNPLVADRRCRNVLLCPSDASAEKKYDCTSYAYSMAFYFSPDQIDGMTSFGDTVTPPGPPCTAQSKSAVRHPSQKALVTEWISNHESPHVGWNDPSTAWLGGRNYLFADGHVAYLKSARIRPANDGLPDINLTHGGIRGKDID
jgi:prepilin-type processing-associated H-X9-DG protein